MKNVDKIKQMKTEDLAKFICLRFSCCTCPVEHLCSSDKGNGMLNWLESEVEE